VGLAWGGTVQRYVTFSKGLATKPGCDEPSGKTEHSLLISTIVKISAPKRRLKIINYKDIL
jgi:hypothetical protein